MAGAIASARIGRAREAAEHWTEERCFITEVANDASDPAVSIALARVEPGVITAWHRLEGIVERYLILAGEGRVEIEGLAPSMVEPGDVVHIPAGVPQRIANVGGEDLRFYAICSPRYVPERYVGLE
jgi:mannose-6-phosphate isomerase-like protein (cupin superfamily)